MANIEVMKSRIEEGSAVSITRIPRKFVGNFTKAGLFVGTRGKVYDIPVGLGSAFVDFKKDDTVKMDCRATISLNCLSLA